MSEDERKAALQRVPRGVSANRKRSPLPSDFWLVPRRPTLQALRSKLTAEFCKWITRYVSRSKT
jgi:hypothetical protein